MSTSTVKINYTKEGMRTKTKRMFEEDRNDAALPPSGISIVRDARTVFMVEELAVCKRGVAGLGAGA